MFAVSFTSIIKLKPRRSESSEPQGRKNFNSLPCIHGCLLATVILCRCFFFLGFALSIFPAKLIHDRYTNIAPLRYCF